MADTSIKLYDLDITSTQRESGRTECQVLFHGQISKQNLKNAMKEIEQHKIIPETSCLYSLTVSIRAEQGIKMSLSGTTQTNIQESETRYANIEIQFRNCHKCPTTNCVHNITNNKCHDEFAMNIIKNFCTQTSEAHK
ncbi:MAG: hypothetical protein J6Y07_02165 [Alphaproteobacteria bacterium]|nr:hypothetical protein [Alphaproteobacteria bacterium]